jgi:hypothetical protein
MIAIKARPFLSWVDDHCASGISRLSCNKCFFFGPSQCLADSTTCYQSTDKVGSTCAYTICRESFLQYFIDKSYAAYVSSIAFFTFQACLLIATIYLYVHSNYTVKVQNGRRSIVARTDAPMVDRRYSTALPLLTVEETQGQGTRNRSRLGRPLPPPTNQNHFQFGEDDDR